MVIMERVIEDIELVTRPTSSTQFYIFNLFGEFFVPRGGSIWTNDLLYLLSLLGVSERAARTTLSRMKQKGWFDTVRDGRQSQYFLTERGQTILAEGDKRIFEEPFQDWDGRWHLVVYSLPEKKRKLRNEFRKKLLWFGFGNLAPGTWISPHDRRWEITHIAEELEILPYINLFTADSTSGEEIVSKCWDIPNLETDYTHFRQRYQPDYEAMRDGWLTPSAEDCFVRRFWLVYNFQRFPLKDPNLPVELLPDPWIGHQARQLFLNYRLLLEEGMGTFISQMTT